MLGRPPTGKSSRKMHISQSGRTRQALVMATKCVQYSESHRRASVAEGPLPSINTIIVTRQSVSNPSKGERADSKDPIEIFLLAITGDSANLRLTHTQYDQSPAHNEDDSFSTLFYNPWRAVIDTQLGRRQNIIRSSAFRSADHHGCNG